MKVIIARLLILQDIELQSSATSKRPSEVETLRSQIPAAMLGRFDKFLSRGKKGVALVQNSICKGCQIALPVGLVNELINGHGTHVCGNCGRYLSLSETDAALFQAGRRADTIVVAKPIVPTASPQKSQKRAKRKQTD